MPVVPQFRVSQDADNVLVSIRVPYVRVSDMDFHVAGDNFSFYCKPYLLKLVLPGTVMEDEDAHAKFDPDNVGG